MGTRGLTVIILNNKIRLSNYQQWDSYYEYTGRKFLEFCRNNLNNDVRISDFIKKVDLLKDISTDIDVIAKINEQVEEWNNEKYKIDINNLFPQFSRDTGIEILNIVNSLKTFDFKQKQKFPIIITTDTSWIEYINVINLDKKEVYMLRLDTGRYNISTCDLVQKMFTDFECYLKYKLDKIPTVKTVDRHYKATLGEE